MARSKSTSSDLSGERPTKNAPLVDAALSGVNSNGASSHVQTSTEDGGKVPPQNINAC